MRISIRRRDDSFLTVLKTDIEFEPAAGDAMHRWEQIVAALRAEIAAGRIAPGQRLPNETLLAQRFGVNRHTLRQAVRQLVHEGHLRVRHDSGTYVRELVRDYALQRRTRMTENLAQAGERAARELLAHERRAAGEWATALRIAPRAGVELLHTRATVRGRAIGISTSAYPTVRLAGIAKAFREAGSITGALRHFGIDDYVRAQSTVSCRLPSAAEADALARPATEPVLSVRFHSVDAGGVPIEAGCTLFAADAVQLTVVHE